jgi:predicted DCC family thiol-disulfide oxidoreductase YuxK
MTCVVILFDGVCSLCSWSVQFILRRDPNGYFRFAAMQSPIGQHFTNG